MSNNSATYSECTIYAYLHLYSSYSPRDIYIANTFWVKDRPRIHFNLCNSLPQLNPARFFTLIHTSTLISWYIQHYNDYNNNYTIDHVEKLWLPCIDIKLGCIHEAHTYWMSRYCKIELWHDAWCEINLVKGQSYEILYTIFYHIKDSSMRYKKLP